MFIKNGDGKIVSVIKEEELDEKSKKKLKKLVNSSLELQEDQNKNLEK